MDGKSEIKNQNEIVDVIQTTDPAAQVMFNSGFEIGIDPNQLHDTQTNSRRERKVCSNPYPNAYVRIIEQPAPVRFRYGVEGDRSPSSIKGLNNTSENKTFPSIQVVNYVGRAAVVVSCMTKEKPYRAHPHKLVGKNTCSEGVCTQEINNESMIATFCHLGIQCQRKKDVTEALKEREKIRVDPFRNGFSHASQLSSTDLTWVRLCFQVFLMDPNGHSFNIPLPPVISEPIFDTKKFTNLVIHKLSKPSCNVAGGEEIILLCGKVAKEDIQVRFFEEKQGVIVWEGYGDFKPSDVHYRTAISFRTPKYKTLDMEQPVKCFIQLRKPSDKTTSQALPFEYLPLNSNRFKLKHKRLEAEEQLNQIFPAQNNLGWLQQSPSQGTNKASKPALEIPHNYNLPTPQNQPYTHPFNFSYSNSISPNSPNQDLSQQSHYDIGNYNPSVSPLHNQNIINQQYQTRTTSPNQCKVPNEKIVNVAVHFIDNDSSQTNQIEHRNNEDILKNNNLDEMNSLDNVTAMNNENDFDNFSNMSISSLLDLDSQQQISSISILTSDMLNEIIKNLDDGEIFENHATNPTTTGAMQPNNFNYDDENMSDSFKQISLE